MKRIEYSSRDTEAKLLCWPLGLNRIRRAGFKKRTSVDILFKLEVISIHFAQGGLHVFVFHLQATWERLTILCLGVQVLYAQVTQILI
jgi:hypothetical protein